MRSSEWRHSVDSKYDFVEFDHLRIHVDAHFVGWRGRCHFIRHIGKLHSFWFDFDSEWKRWRHMYGLGNTCRRYKLRIGDFGFPDCDDSESNQHDFVHKSRDEDLVELSIRPDDLGHIWRCTHRDIVNNRSLHSLWHDSHHGELGYLHSDSCRRRKYKLQRSNRRRADIHYQQGVADHFFHRSGNSDLVVHSSFNKCYRNVIAFGVVYVEHHECLHSFGHQCHDGDVGFVHHRGRTGW